MASASVRPGGWFGTGCFCGLGIADSVPDANTLWDFREALIKVDALDALLQERDLAITLAWVIPRAGQIIDASLIAPPCQRSPDGEKTAIKTANTGRRVWADTAYRSTEKSPATAP